MVSTFLGEVGFRYPQPWDRRPAGSARRGCPEAIDECPNKNRISVAFAIEWNSGMYSGDPAVFFVLSVIIDEMIQ
jgi:hypothetical protein